MYSRAIVRSVQAGARFPSYPSFTSPSSPPGLRFFFTSNLSDVSFSATPPGHYFFFANSSNSSSMHPLR